MITNLIIQSNLRSTNRVLEIIPNAWQSLSKIIAANPDLATLEFRQPIEYKSFLAHPEKFQNNEYFVQQHVKSSVVVVSHTQRADGHGPVFYLEKLPSTNTDNQESVDVQQYSVRLSTFEAITKMLDTLGIQNSAELETLFKDPGQIVRKIFGTKSEFLSNVIKELRVKCEQKIATVWKARYAMMLKLAYLMAIEDAKEFSEHSTTIVSKSQAITMADAEAEYEALKALTGWAVWLPLKSIDWDVDYVFCNGTRSPPWRQEFGELGYLEIRLQDREKLVATVAKNGYFLNKGYTKNEKDREVLNFEREGEIYPSLVSLLRAQSVHFQSVFEKQEELINQQFKVKLVENSKSQGNDSDTNHNAAKSASNAKEGASDSAERASKVQKGSGKAGAVNQRRAPEVEIDTNSDCEDEMMGKHEDPYEPSPDYWQLQKFTKYLRIGNQTATVIAISAMRDCDLQIPSNQLALRDLGSLEMLINLLETDDPRCVQGALIVLKDVSQNPLSEYDAIKPLIHLLSDVDNVIQCLAAEVLANCGKNGKYNGVRKLVRLLTSQSDNVVRCGALALCSCSKSSKNRSLIEEHEALPLLARLLASSNEQLLIPVVGTLYECAMEEKYRIIIRDLGMVQSFVEILQRSKNRELQTYCANALCQCAKDLASRNIIQASNGLQPLVSLLDASSETALLAAATGAVWNCAQSPENVTHLIKMGSIKKLVGSMDNQTEDVLINVVGALGACAQIPEGRTSIREANGISPLVQLLKRTDPRLLVNVTRAVGSCAMEVECMTMIDRLDGVRLLWSLLKSPESTVQASAGWALSPCIENAKDAGEMVRSFVGGLELIVSLLKSTDIEVLAGVCAAIAKIAKDEENLAVITDHGVIPMLAKLTHTKEDRLRKTLAEAIANCCPWGTNRSAFANAKAVGPLVRFLKSSDVHVHRATAAALFQLSVNPNNCAQMHDNGAVALLLDLIGRGDEVLQEAAAGTLANIRRLALASDAH